MCVVLILVDDFASFLKCAIYTESQDKMKWRDARVTILFFGASFSSVCTTAWLEMHVAKVTCYTTCTPNGPFVGQENGFLER